MGARRPAPEDTQRWVPVFTGTAMEMTLVRAELQARGYLVWWPELHLQLGPYDWAPVGDFEWYLAVPEDQADEVSKYLEGRPRSEGWLRSRGGNVEVDAETAARVRAEELATQITELTVFLIFAPFAVLLGPVYIRLAGELDPPPRHHRTTMVALGLSVFITTIVTWWMVRAYL